MPSGGDEQGILQSLKVEPLELELQALCAATDVYRDPSQVQTSGPAPHPPHVHGTDEEIHYKVGTLFCL